MITSKLQRELPYATHLLEVSLFKERSFTSFPLSKGHKGRVLPLLPREETHRNDDGRNLWFENAPGQGNRCFQGVKIVFL